MQTHVSSCRPNGIVEVEIQRVLNLAKTRKTANTFHVPLMQSLLNLTANTLCSVADSPFTTLCKKIDSLTHQFMESQKVSTSESMKPVSSRASPLSVPAEAPIPDPHPL